MSTVDDKFMHIESGIDDIGTAVRDFTKPNDNVAKHGYGRTILYRPTGGEGPLLLFGLKGDISRLLFSTEQNKSLYSLTPNIARWFQGQFAKMLLDIFMLDESETCQDRDQTMLDIPIHLCEVDVTNGETRCPWSPLCLRLLDGLESRSLKYCKVPSIATDIFATKVSSGSLSMLIKRVCVGLGVTNIQGNLVAQFLFIPDANKSPSGVAASVRLRMTEYPIQVTRTLSTFIVHPEDSSVFLYLKTRNLSMIRQMAFEGKLTPNDRDIHGNTILWVRILTYNP
jgi:hypothetical protein